MAETNTEQVRAVILNGVVDTTMLMSDETLLQWEELGFIEMMWPGGLLLNITELSPQPSTGWSWDGNTFAAPPEQVDPDEPIEDETPVDQTPPSIPE